MSIGHRASGEWNKSLWTNLSCLSLIGAGSISPIAGPQILSMGLFGLGGAITNWLAIHMLFERIPGLYGSGIIPSKFEEFKQGIEHLMMSQFFTEENLKTFIHDQLDSSADQQWDPEPLIQKIDYDALFEKMAESVHESPLGSMLQLFGGATALEPLKTPFQSKMQLVIRELVKKDSFRDELKASLAGQIDSKKILEQIDQVVRKRLDELTPQMVKEIIQEMIRQHLGWLVIWGGFFGSLIGLIASTVV